MRPSLSRRSRRFSSLLMASALAVSLVQTTTAADRTSGFKLAANQPTKIGKTIKVDVDKAARTKDGRVAIIVKLKNDSVASYTGGVSGLKATNPKTLGNKTIKLKSAATVAYRSYLQGKQDAFIKRLDSSVKRAKVTGQTDIVLNAVSVIVPPDSVASIAKMPGVAAIYPDVLQQPLTDVSPQYIGADTIWGDLGGQESAGEGVIVGVLDTGIWPEHPSFADPDPSGKAYDAPPDPPTGTRACDFGSEVEGDEDFECNNKLIGAERVMDTYDAVAGRGDEEFDSARDDDGHGTHTSSTSAGDSGVEASIFGVERGIISGVAPRAWVEMFKVCGEGGCYTSDTTAATQAAIEDGVNVINFSISGGANPYSDATELAFLDAYNAGIFVAASAGNSGPDPDTTDHRGGWVTTVAASTAPRAFVDTIHLTADGGATLDLAGTSLTAGVGPAPVVVAGDPLCGPGGDYTGKIVVCERGTYGRAEKGFNAATAGAVGMILYNQGTGVTDVETDNHWLPASHIQYAQGQQVLTFLTGHTGVMATISAGVTGTQQPDVMASFSSRGGPGQRLGISKPDITAPGVQILAGAAPIHVPDPALGPEGELFQAIAGTSMSSPHIAGSGALLKALHPEWTPGQIKSAIMTTAQTADLVKEDGTTPFDAFDAGSGRVNLDYAGDPGLTFDVTGNDYLLFENELFRSNYPSIYYPSMPGIATLTKVARSVLGSKSDWKLTTSGPSDLKLTVPSTLSVLPGADKSFTVKIDASRVPIGQTRFASIKLTQTSGGHRVLHMPVTIVRGQADVTLTKECTPTKLKQSAKTKCTVTVTNPTFDAATYKVKDVLPKKLELKKSSVHGATTVTSKKVVAEGTLAAADPADVDAEICDLCSPGGYIPLSLYEDTEFGGASDESITNFTGFGEFEYAGETYDTIGFVSDGYAVVGGGTGADVDFINQILPDSAQPNNVLAPFWTDLNPEFGGATRIAILGDASGSWLVLEWDAVEEYASGNTDTMQIWIGLNGVEDITYTYGEMGSGDGGYATVGAENRYGNRGANVYADGDGTIPVADTEILVSTTPGTMDSHSITFKAKNVKSGDWTNCATLRSDAFLGTSYSCVSGTNK